MRAKLLKTAMGRIEVDRLEGEAGSSLPLVFLHHGFGSAASLRHLAEHLREIERPRPAVFYSRPGCGASPPRPRLRELDYLHVEAEQVLPAVLDALDLPRAILIGHSDGGSIALLAAALIPERVAAAVAVAPHVFVEKRTLEGVRDLAATADDPAFRARLAQRHADPAAAFDSWRDAWLSPAFTRWSALDLLPRICAPLLLQQGDHDEFATLAQLDAIERAVSGPVRRHVLRGLGHFPQNQDPGAISAEIARFLTPL